MKKFAFLIVIVLLTGCAAKTIQLMPTGGSKADGTVTLSSQIIGSSRQFDLESAAWASFNESAKSSCQNWGYSDAQAFGELEHICVLTRRDKCIKKKLGINYQCTDE